MKITIKCKNEKQNKSTEMKKNRNSKYSPERQNTKYEEKFEKLKKEKSKIHEH